MREPHPLLAVDDLSIDMTVARGTVRILDGVSFSLASGETLGVVGESGSGKTMTALAIMRLLPQPSARLGAESRILFSGKNVLKLDERAMRRLRGREISMIFQDPMTALNPLFTVGEQIAETVRWHEGGTRAAAQARAVDMLRAVRIPHPERAVRSYPHQFSGGMRQRATIAIALACRPKILIADEPTTALDVTVQAQIFDLLEDIQEETGTAIILISHNLSTIARLTRRIMVLYGGRKVEEGPTREIIRNPRHPYTEALLRCVPGLRSEAEHDAELPEIPGTVPAPEELGGGCPFAPRCSHAAARCRSTMPPAAALGEKHKVACWLHEAAQSAVT